MDDVRTVRWPGDANDASAEDLLRPLQDLLTHLAVLEKPGEAATLRSTPASAQVITAGATALAKVYAALAASGGVAAAAAAAVTFWRGLDGSTTDVAVQRAAVLAAIGLFGSAVVVSVALIVRGDVLARAHATAAEYEARARIATAFLRSARPSAPPEARYAVRTDGGLRRVREFRWDARTGGAVAVADGGDVMPTAEWRDLVSLDDTTDGAR